MKIRFSTATLMMMAVFLLSGCDDRDNPVYGEDDVDYHEWAVRKVPFSRSRFLLDSWAISDKEHDAADDYLVPKFYLQFDDEGHFEGGVFDGVNCHEACRGTFATSSMKSTSGVVYTLEGEIKLILSEESKSLTPSHQEAKAFLDYVEQVKTFYYSSDETLSLKIEDRRGFYFSTELRHFWDYKDKYPDIDGFGDGQEISPDEFKTYTKGYGWKEVERHLVNKDGTYEEKNVWDQNSDITPNCYEFGDNWVTGYFVTEGEKIPYHANCTMHLVHNYKRLYFNYIESMILLSLSDQEIKALDVSKGRTYYVVLHRMTDEELQGVRDLHQIDNYDMRFGKRTYEDNPDKPAYPSFPANPIYEETITKPEEDISAMVTRYINGEIASMSLWWGIDPQPISASEVFSQYVKHPLEENFRFLYGEKGFAANEQNDYYMQYYKDVAVPQGGYHLYVFGGVTNKLEGNFIQITDLNVVPAIDEQKAKEIYADYLKVSVDDIEGGKMFDDVADALMIIEIPEKWGSDKFVPRLVYGLTYKGNSYEGNCFIDAQTGRILRTCPNFNYTIFLKPWQM